MASFASFWLRKKKSVEVVEEVSVAVGYAAGGEERMRTLLFDGAFG